MLRDHLTTLKVRKWSIDKTTSHHLTVRGGGGHTPENKCTLLDLSNRNNLDAHCSGIPHRSLNLAFLSLSSMCICMCMHMHACLYVRAYVLN